MDGDNEQQVMLSEEMLLPFPLLEKITNGFSADQQIAEGGFSVVYKGLLDGKAVAVKKLKELYIDDKTFSREVRCLTQLNPHNNIVRFLGYYSGAEQMCVRYEGTSVMADHNRHRLLCFEYQPDSLCRRISDASSGLGWIWRYQIIKGICNGLHYLHKMEIVHLDLKPANILLDSKMVPKITDFGISRCFDGQSQLFATRIAVTRGYYAPEIVNNVITMKLDIYSLGVIILQILTGHIYHTLEVQEERSDEVLKDVLESWKNRLETSRGDTYFVFPKEMGDQLLEQSEKMRDTLLEQSEKMRETLLNQVRVCAEIGIQCMNTDPAQRPDIDIILHRLGETGSTDGFTEAMQVPMQIFPKWRRVAPLVPQSIHGFPSMNAAFCCAQVAEGVDKIGPCGGGGGEHYDTIKIPQCLKSITVWNGLIIDSIQFSYQDREKTLHTTDRWGGPGGFEQVTIKLDDDTCLKRMSGTYAPFNDETVVITSLTFVTSNNIKYGPLGGGGGMTFDIHLSEGSIVGFFVRAGWFIDAIGVYVRR
ncbi:hypothetical protein SEVIR_2G121700v4 [Setaria viridis]|uniref:non-specific serine/threonine protein kinase n=1 Tax=Setaria viridis TaxID=4556 RepID=A0A4U6VRZ3_SETVI|nr:interleukin-1 receptor-associated kinase 4-like [Setaria viridis]XP_034579486.1 interleukin-1 receptor-associated kinase 4-like [Setaria viridis]XP_034579487.1 interleukin-1 receptor-associated kinase 4-like [Setaria viridis]TKW31685.1 hypothetical protein SEVIR_2G121700v2 [Setaria viridis]TKW31686.1 hypothetical protein SEVIR_2G121700v2 [Setaria viridis]